MKIGILTQPLQNNYGGLLQNYALQQVLKEMGHNPVTLDYKSRSLPAWYELLCRSKGIVRHIISPKNNPKPKYRPTNDELDIIEQNTRRFINRSINRTNKCIGGEDFKKEVENRGIEALIVGSDQCWRPLYNAYIEEMFLQFAESLPIKKRVAYAASFGTSTWEYSPTLTEQCAHLAKKFDLVTVREKSGIDLCREHLGVEAIHVLDPTMLLNKENYISLVEAEKVPENSNTLFHYILDPTAEKKAFIEKVAMERGLKSFTIMPKCQAENRTKRDIKHRIGDCVFPSVTSWLRGFMDAEMVVVDSFHGAVFSIIFNKPFWVLANAERGNSRFESLLGLFELEERMITTESLTDDFDLNMEIDWEGVNRIRQKEAIRCKSLLEESLKH